MKWLTLNLLLITTIASGQSGYNYYKNPERVGSTNEKAFAYFRKAYYDHIWTWTRTGSDSAVYNLQRAIKEDSLYGAAYAFLGHVYKFKTYDGADKDEFKNQKWYAEKAIKLRPDLGDAYTLMATVKWTEGDTIAALNYLRHAVKIEPDHIGNYIWLGMRLSAIPQKKDSAVSCFHKIMKMDPQYGQAYMKLAYLYETTSEYDSALSYYKKAIQHFEHVKPRDLRMVNGYLYSAYILKDNYKNYDAASAYLRTFIHEVLNTDFMVKDQSLMEAYGLLADCYKKLSEQEMSKLISHNNRFIKNNPNDYERLYQTIDSYLVLDIDSINSKYALPLIQSLQSISITNEQRQESLFLEIDLWKKMGDYSKALKILTQFNKANPNYLWVLFENGRLYAITGQNDKSMDCLTRAKSMIKTDNDKSKFENELRSKDFDRLRADKNFKRLMK